MDFRVNSIDALTISSGGSTTFSAPTTTTKVATFDSTNTNGGYIDFRRSNTVTGYLGNGALLGSTVLDALELRAANDLYLTAGASGSLQISSGGTATFSGVVNIPIGAEATPSLIFAGDSDSGMWHPAANTLAFSTFGNERMRISSGGNVGIGISPDVNGRLTIRGDGDSSTSNTIAAYNFTNALIFNVRDDGVAKFSGEVQTLQGFHASGATPYINFDDNVGSGAQESEYRIDTFNGDFRFRNIKTSTTPMYISADGSMKVPQAYTGTTGAGANLVVLSSGQLIRSTSSLKYKTDVRDYDKGLNEVMQLKPKYYKGKDDGNTQFAGLIAEDVHDLGLTEFVQYADDESPDALSYSHMIALSVKAIQEQQTIIDTLTARLDALEKKA